MIDLLLIEAKRASHPAVTVVALQLVVARVCKALDMPTADFALRVEETRHAIAQDEGLAKAVRRG